MAQVDKLNYLPLLFWFVLLFVFIYANVFIKTVPAFFTIIKTRKKFFMKLMKLVKKNKYLSFWLRNYLFKLQFHHWKLTREKIKANSTSCFTKL